MASRSLRECPDPGPAVAAEIAAQASARIPLVVGLTLTNLWKPNATEERECLLQVRSMDARGITMSNSCNSDDVKKDVQSTRRICYADMRDACIYHTEFGRFLPETLTGTTQFSLSVKSFADFVSKGEMRHRYIQLRQKKGPPPYLYVQFDYAGTLKRVDTSQHVPWALDLYDTQEVIVNDRPVKLPVLHARGDVQSADGQDDYRMTILDDPHVPLVLEYEHVAGHFRIRYTKISYPTSGSIEKALEEEKHVDVYGIYFDFASDQLRPESEPVLREVAEALRKNPTWSLDIQGHTDNVGGDAFNLDLSKRRSEAVRKALVEQYAIDGARLSTSGFGASQPKESNDTSEGRARNRRVELVRH